MSFGDNIYLGPNCTFDTLNVPLEITKRAERIISSKEIKIGNNAYFEGAIKVSSGVTIGDNVIIKSGSIINKNIPNNSLVEGNPFRIFQTNIAFNFKDYIQEMINKDLTDENYIIIFYIVMPVTSHVYLAFFGNNSRNVCNEFNNAKFENLETINNNTSKLFKSYKSLFLTQNVYIKNGSNSLVGEIF